MFCFPAAILKPPLDQNSAEKAIGRALDRKAKPQKATAPQNLEGRATLPPVATQWPPGYC
jgi:hypothetical protein